MRIQIGALLLSAAACCHAHDDPGVEPLGRPGAEYDSHNFEILGHVSREELGGSELIVSDEHTDTISISDLWGWTDPVTRDEYAIVTRSDSTAFVRITDPRNPLYLGSLPSENWNAFWRDVKTYGNYAFIVADEKAPPEKDEKHGMQVFDMTRLRDLDAPPDQWWSADALYQEFNAAHNVVINPETGTLAAVAASAGSFQFSAGFHYVDISDPLNPVSAGGGGEGYVHDAQIISYRGADEDHAGKEVAFAFNRTALSIYDTNDSTRLISRTEYEGAAYAHQGWVTDDHRFLLMNDESDEGRFGQPTRTHIWNIEDLDNPTHVGYHEHETEATDHNLYIHGDFAYLANYNAGMRILDISDIENANLKEVAYVDSRPDQDGTGYFGAWSTYPFFDSGTVIFSDTREGLIIGRLAIGESAGDFDQDGELDIDDVNELSQAIFDESIEERFDLNDDARVDIGDLEFWVHELKETAIGDANLDGVFGTGDLVDVFTTNEYEDAISENSTWESGDWNGDREFNSRDFLIAFQHRGFNPTANVLAVPEPATGFMSLMFLVTAALWLRSAR